ncbi:hypothetical protein [Corynebacterium belfantii]|uniref:hypothetical protein n=1 Tax=Corynebacterium belfantii TaxID=2014537 RepID=UPI00095921EF|nr:hypothetical protein BUE64_11415 [Corynebacterium diphtheriae subsp. lausannense]OWM36499.1 hypothetical protein AZF07_09710 [Corynebacterium diphtheriae subsp. lausannense]
MPHPARGGTKGLRPVANLTSPFIDIGRDTRMNATHCCRIVTAKTMGTQLKIFTSTCRSFRSAPVLIAVPQTQLNTDAIDNAGTDRQFAHNIHRCQTFKPQLGNLIAFSRTYPLYLPYGQPECTSEPINH